MKFLHIADVHLGCTRYHLEESQRDFFEAWIDVLERYAIGEKVDFVVMCGDFFHKRSVPPETMNYAFEGLSRLKAEDIPVVSIEGNHDQKHRDSEYSWLRSLADWDLVYLLEPTMVEGKLGYVPWDKETKRGGFIDIGRARIYGSDWFGAAANAAIPQLVRQIEKNRKEGAFHILLLHTDVEGHETHPIPALSREKLEELRAVTEYVGLGHTHKCFEIDNWVFNPGSLEITNIVEYSEKRGAWLVEVDESNAISARHIEEYVQRPFQRLTFDVSRMEQPDQVSKGVLNLVKTQGHRFDGKEGERRPIIEITLTGHLGFPASELELKKIRDKSREISGALHVRLKNHSVPIELASAAGLEEGVPRDKLERRVIEDLIYRDKRFNKRTESIAEAVIGAKNMVLSDDEPEKIADFIAIKSSDEADQKAA
ncbi:MAG: DNA repair exonuclease [Acidobacteria bacterium]|nr:MAG: DNA repair exonuclease [Acidobacteriota bacterium]REK04009.1 MAG: DNA repair exonuclease [Acidobacteriota bacterium]REK15171.1 MAG: DNA repair exonuclease [Acidobacteriota bacterium]REK46261.1 MAG: DNA repair exonuclease [Acidobacteriota bacterium]